MSVTPTAKHFRGRGFLVSLYTPSLSKDRDRRELGFLVRVRDPRGPTIGRFDPHAKDKPQANWRWLKVFIGWTNPKLVDARGKTFVAEVETHLTDRLMARTSYKTYARIKLAKGAPRRS